MESHEQSFATVIESLRNPPPSLRREARIVRRTAVVLAVLDVLVGGAGDGGSSSVVVTASKVYAQCITALEGTLTNHDTTGTQIALLEVLSFVLPHVEPPAILSATLPLTSRVLRAVVALAEQDDHDETMKGEKEAADQTGGGNALLRWVALVSSILMVRLPDKDEKDVKQLLTVTLLNHFNDRRPKVRKAVHNHTVEMLSRTDGCPRVIVTTITKFCHDQFAPPLRQIASSSSSLANGNMDWYQQSSHLFAFLERAIVHLHFNKLTEDIMNLLSALLTIPKLGGPELFVTTKIKQNTPRVLAISSLAAIVLVMLQDEDERRQHAIDELAPRVLASVLRGQTAAILNEDAAEYEVLDKARVLCGQIVLHSCSRNLQSGHNRDGSNAATAAAAIKLLPLAMQFIRTMCLPSVDGDITVAQTLMVELAQHLRMVLPQLRTEQKCLADAMKTLQVVVQEPKYRATWPVSLKCLTILLPYLSDEATKADIFESFVAAHSNKASAASKSAVEAALSTLVEQIGIEPTWNWIRWNPASPKGMFRNATFTLLFLTMLPQGGIALDRAWLLTILKNAATSVSSGGSSTRLDFFQSAVMPLARLCDQLAATRPPAERNYHRTCVVRVWELFPCFCAAPEDVEEIFPSLSDTLCKALGDTRYPELLVSSIGIPPPLLRSLTRQTHQTTICNGLSILVKSTQDAGSFELEETSGGARAISTATMKLLPTLFKLVSDAHTSAPQTSAVEGEPDMETNVPANDQFQKLQTVSEAIASVSRLAPPDFLQGMFKKVMQKLLEQFQLESGESERICSLLTLAQALVTSEVLDEPSVSFLYRALKPLIKDGEQEPRVQKRAYKVLLQICERYSSFVAAPERLTELCDLLTATVSNSQISARYMRLKCMNSLVKDMKRDEAGMVRALILLYCFGSLWLCDRAY
jgi:NUC173 domain